MIRATADHGSGASVGMFAGRGQPANPFVSSQPHQATVFWEQCIVDPNWSPRQSHRPERGSSSRRHQSENLHFSTPQPPTHRFARFFQPRNSETAISVFKLLKSRQKLDPQRPRSAFGWLSGKSHPRVESSQTQNHRRRWALASLPNPAAEAPIVTYIGAESSLSNFVTAIVGSNRWLPRLQPPQITL
jgi:hypothetical protein